MRTLVKNYSPVQRVSTFPTLFDTFFNDYDRIQKPSVSKTLPLVNVVENEESFRIELAAPGLTRADFKVNIHEDVLTISSEKQAENEETKENYTRREFSYASFNRSFNLPDTVDSDNIAATYNEGILNLTLPKKEEAKPKEPKMIEVA
ncbi:MAG: Hsp20/alpha crystallin family protein [Spirosomaceae bacterium]|nr:Hsp20/alpha crystallin family protein [Spirosomataceae bacterium]MDP5140982.1 Hsp20/alpha crystallin family protein [Spirosomataceae bacterium]